MSQELQDLELNEKIEDEDDSEDDVVEDEDEDEDDVVAPVRYDISTYGADYDVEGLVKRLERGDIIIPDFQRNYIWKQSEASRFIESLLLGLPIPAIFLSKETQSNKFLVIDGQQRLKTLQFFFNGFFNPQGGEDNREVFKLIKVQTEFEGLTYETLPEEDKRKLNDSLIHAIIVKQESPENENTSIYHIFDRLNREGRHLNPQEIRTAIDHGKFIDLIKELNEYDNWRIIYGKKSSRLKDQELVLRFLAFYFDGDQYEEPMKEFLNKFSQKKRTANKAFLTQAREIFTSTNVEQVQLVERILKPSQIGLSTSALLVLDCWRMPSKNFIVSMPLLRLVNLWQTLSLPHSIKFATLKLNVTPARAQTDNLP